MSPRRVDRSRTNAIGPDTELRLLHRHAAHECVDPAFRSAIRRVLRQTDHARLRAGRDDVATKLLQMRQRESGHHEGRTNIHSNRLIEIGDRIILRHRVIEKDAGVVHQHIELFEFFDCDIDALLRDAFLGNIAAERDRFAPLIADRLCHVLDRIARQSTHHHLRAFPRELVRDRFTDAGAGAGHDRHLTLQPSVLFLRSIAAEKF